MRFTIFNLFSCFLLTVSAASAQSLEITKGNINYEKTNRAAIHVKISPETKSVKKAWKKFIQKNYDADVEGLGLFSNKDILSAKEARIDMISDKTMDLHAQILEKGDHTEMMVFGALGYDVFINPDSYAREYAAMEDLVIDFLNDFLPDYIQENVEEIEGMIADLKDTRKEMKKQIEDNKKDVKKMEAEIETRKKDNVQLEKDLIDNAEAIEKTNTKLRIKKRKLEAVKEKLGKG